MDLHDSDVEELDPTTDRPPKRPRRSSPHAHSNGHGAPSHSEASRSPTGGSASGSGNGLPLLAPSILGVEPLDEFIREIADFVHYTISTRPPDAGGSVEVEAKIGVLKERGSGQRVQLPVLVESSKCYLGLCCSQRSVMQLGLTVWTYSHHAEYARHAV